MQRLGILLSKNMQILMKQINKDMDATEAQIVVAILGLEMW